MVCPLTVRTLKPRRSSAEHGYAEQLEAIAPYVESVGADGLYDIVQEYTT